MFTKSSCSNLWNQLKKTSRNVVLLSFVEQNKNCYFYCEDLTKPVIYSVYKTTRCLNQSVYFMYHYRKLNVETRSLLIRSPIYFPTLWNFRNYRPTIRRFKYRFPSFTRRIVKYMWKNLEQCLYICKYMSSPVSPD